VVEASRQAWILWPPCVSGFRDHLGQLPRCRVSAQRRQHRATSGPAQRSPGGHRHAAVGGAARHPSLNLPFTAPGLLPAHELEDVESSLEAWSDRLSATSISAGCLPLLEPPHPNPGPAGHSQDPIRWCLKQASPQPQPRAQSRPTPSVQPGAPGDRQRCRLSLSLPEASELAWPARPGAAAPGNRWPMSPLQRLARA